MDYERKTVDSGENGETEALIKAYKAGTGQSLGRAPGVELISGPKNLAYFLRHYSSSFATFFLALGP